MTEKEIDSITGMGMGDYLAQIGTEYDLPPEWYDDARQLIFELSLSDDPEYRITYKKMTPFQRRREKNN